MDDLLDARALARRGVEERRDAEMRHAGRSAARDWRWRGGDRVSGRREDDLAAAWGEARRLQVPPGVLRLEVGTGVRAVDVRGPDGIGISLSEMGVDEPIASR